MANSVDKRGVERAVQAFATRRWGVFRLDQVADLGLSRGMAADRAKAGRLFRIHEGVYSVVAPRLLKLEGFWLAAVLACGPGAVLSHACAAALWALWRAPSGPIHVTIPNSSARRRPGIVIHRSTALAPAEMTVRRGIPVTTLARTLADVKRTLPAHLYQAALRQAERARLNTGLAIREPDSMTAFEARLLALCRRHSLPLPRAQQIIGPYTVDFLWPDVGLIVEMDDFKTHGTRSAFESDRERDAWLIAQGYRVIRFTWRQLNENPARVVAVIRAALGIPKP